MDDEEKITLICAEGKKLVLTRKVLSLRYVHAAMSSSLQVNANYTSQPRVPGHVDNWELLKSE